MEEDAALIENACINVLETGLRTADIMAPGTARVGTNVMGESILRELDKLAAWALGGGCESRERWGLIPARVPLHPAAWLRP